MSHTFEVVVSREFLCFEYGIDIQQEVTSYMKMNPSVEVMKLVITEYFNRYGETIYILDRIEV